MIELGNPEGELSILLTDDTEMKQLNRKYRNSARTTDVLSFSSSGGPGPEILGDIVIAIPFVKRQAKRIGNPFEREVLFLIVHGLLHLLGYGHELSKKEAGRMEIMQKKLMSLGYAP